MFTLALKSMLNRRFTTVVTIVSVALSVTLLLGVERIRKEARRGFSNTVSGTDLIVGARSGPVQLLLYSVFHIGNATNNISWQSYSEIAANPNIDWTIPLSLGDSHRGYRILGTNSDYFERFRYGGGRRLELARGRVFEDVFDAVLGAAVAQALGYQVGDSLVITHGAGEISFLEHDDKPFRVVGILERTGTPVDQTIHILLEGMEAIHVGWHEGAPRPGHSISAERIVEMDLTPDAITAFLVGLRSRTAVLEVQRLVNEYPPEPLLAVLPGVALQELWDLIGIAEKALLTVSVFVVALGLGGMLLSLMTSLNERRREMAILRSVGARPFHVFVLIAGESVALTVAGIVAGTGLLYALLLFGQPVILARFGLWIGIAGLSSYELMLISAVCLGGLLVGAIPAYRIYRYSLADGMTIRV